MASDAVLASQSGLRIERPLKRARDEISRPLRMQARQSIAILMWLAASLLLGGCSAKYYQKSADREAYRIIRSKSGAVTNMDPAFTIEQTNSPGLDLLPATTNAADFLGADAERERGARRMSLEDALRIATQISRRYQSEKEKLYLGALELALARHRFTPIFNAAASSKYGVNTVLDESQVHTSDHVVEQHGLTTGAGLGGSWLMRDVGRLTAAITTDFVRFVSADRSLVTSSRVGGTFTRPLLQNAGFKREMESLTQAERDMVYELRDFVRFRKDFSVQVATEYYGVLGRRDAVRNSFLNLESSRKNAERSRALAQEGRITQSDLGRLEQQALSAENSWVSAVRAYKQQLDDFKVSIGLSVDERIVLQDQELEALQILEPRIGLEEAIEVALRARLDYLNVEARLADAGRRVGLQANLLKPRVDLQADAAIQNSTLGSAFVLPKPEYYAWSAGLDVDLGLDRMAERNAYRAALIARHRAERDVAQAEDDIKLQVRDSWRTLDQARRSFEISEIGVKLAERRVEEQDLLAELGRAKAQDQVDAQNALIDSKNQRTQALVTHTIARVQFWNRLGILYIKDNGQWEETRDAKAE